MNRCGWMSMRFCSRVSWAPRTTEACFEAVVYELLMWMVYCRKGQVQDWMWKRWEQTDLQMQYCCEDRQGTEIECFDV